MQIDRIKIDRIFRSVDVNQGKLSKVLAQEMSLLAEPEVWEAIVQAVERAFDDIRSGFQRGA